MAEESEGSYTYRVVVDDNYHHMENGERYELGEFATCEQAVAACKRIVDGFLNAFDGQGKTYAELWILYTTFGDDAFIVTADLSCKFSTRDYAKARCGELAQGQRGT